MKNNIINSDEMYSTIRKSFIRAMPYPLEPSIIESDFLQVYVGRWIDQNEIKIVLHRQKVICSGDGVEYIKDSKRSELYSDSKIMIKAKAVLTLEGQADKCKSLCDDISAMLKWLLQEKYIVQCGPTQYRMTFELLSRKSLL